MVNVRTALKNGITQLREASVPSFTLAAELLLLHVLSRNRTWLYAHPEEILSDADIWAVISFIESTWPADIQERQQRMNQQNP